MKLFKISDPQKAIYVMMSITIIFFILSAYLIWRANTSQIKVTPEEYRNASPYKSS